MSNSKNPCIQENRTLFFFCHQASACQTKLWNGLYRRLFRFSQLFFATRWNLFFKKYTLLSFPFKSRWRTWTKRNGFLLYFLDAFLLLSPPKTKSGKIMQRGRNIFYIDCFGDIRLPMECFKKLGAKSESDKKAQFKSFERMFLHNWA